MQLRSFQSEKTKHEAIFEVNGVQNTVPAEGGGQRMHWRGFQATSRTIQKSFAATAKASPATQGAMMRQYDSGSQFTSLVQSL